MTDGELIFGIIISILFPPFLFIFIPLLIVAILRN